MRRRAFLRSLAGMSAARVIPLAGFGWAARTRADAGPHRLVVVFLRGAVDGLNVVVPYHERDYYLARPSIAIAPPGADGVVDLDGRFGLHPALRALLPLWRERSIAFIHACGSPDPSRSHFDAQDYMESGTPGVKITPDGWMNRLLAELPGAGSARGLNLGPTLPRIFSGKQVVASLPLGKNAARPLPLDRPIVSRAFDRLYQGNDALSRAYRDGRAARGELMQALARDMKQADNGAPSPLGFSAAADRLARLMVDDARIRLAFVALGGWDTHVNQGAASGQLANHLQPLGEGLMTLARGLGAAYRDTTILVLSEFGRTVRENGNGGTDHGHGNVMWVLGGAVRGGKVYGAWPGLNEGDLYQGRDLAITTDFREVISAVLMNGMRLDASRVAHVLPGWRSGAALPSLVRS